MSLPYRIGLYALLLSAAFTSGFFYGRSSGRNDALKAAVTAFQNREKINHDVSKLGDIDLCVALGGMRDECEELMPGMDKTTQARQPGQNGQR